MRKNFVRKVIVGSVVASLVGVMGVGVTSQANASSSVVVVKADFGKKGSVKPKAINPGTASGGVLYKDIKWSYWGKTHARGTAIEQVKTCKPNCADGAVTKQKVTIYLDGVKKGLFTKSVSTSGIVRTLVK